MNDTVSTISAIVMLNNSETPNCAALRSDCAKSVARALCLKIITFINPLSVLHL